MVRKSHLLAGFSVLNFGLFLFNGAINGVDPIVID